MCFFRAFFIGQKLNLFVAISLRLSRREAQETPAFAKCCQSAVHMTEEVNHGGGELSFCKGHFLSLFQDLSSRSKIPKCCESPTNQFSHLEQKQKPFLAFVFQVSKSLYVFAHHDELWRALTLQEFSVGFRYAPEGWKQTFVNHYLNPTANPNPNPSSRPQSKSLRQDPRANGARQSGGQITSLQASPLGAAVPVHRPLQIRGFYSDYLFQSWLCASISVKQEWLERSTVPRRSNLSLQQFIDEFERPNRPVIITDVVESWPAFQKWDREYLLAAAGEEKFACGPVEFTLGEYHAYGDWAREERPLYLFDRYVRGVENVWLQSKGSMDARFL